MKTRKKKAEGNGPATKTVVSTGGYVKGIAFDRVQ
jgi:hypothetical protein